MDNKNLSNLSTIARDGLLTSRQLQSLFEKNSGSFKAFGGIAAGFGAAGMGISIAMSLIGGDSEEVLLLKEIIKSIKYNQIKLVSILDDMKIEADFDRERLHIESKKEVLEDFIKYHFEFFEASEALIKPINYKDWNPHIRDLYNKQNNLALEHSVDTKKGIINKDLQDVMNEIANATLELNSKEHLGSYIIAKDNLIKHYDEGREISVACTALKDNLIPISNVNNFYERFFDYKNGSPLAVSQMTNYFNQLVSLTKVAVLNVEILMEMDKKAKELDHQEFISQLPSFVNDITNNIDKHYNDSLSPILEASINLNNRAANEFVDQMSTCLKKKVFDKPSFSGDNGAAMRSILETLQSTYPGKKWIVAVYNPWIGNEKHFACAHSNWKGFWGQDIKGDKYNVVVKWVDDTFELNYENFNRFNSIAKEITDSNKAWLNVRIFGSLSSGNPLNYIQPAINQAAIDNSIILNDYFYLTTYQEASIACTGNSSLNLVQQINDLPDVSQDRFTYFWGSASV